MQFKKCKKCKRDLPMTNEYFNIMKRNKDGYGIYCWECQGKSFKIIKQTKTCIRCKREFPSTNEYFYSIKVNKDGLNNICKECKGYSFKIKKEGYKICTQCKQELPATIEYFHKNKKQQLDSRCKKCKSKIHEEHKDEINSRLKNFRKENLELVRAKEKEYWSSRRDKKHLISKRYRQTLRGKFKHHEDTAKRRAWKKNVEIKLTADDWQDILIYFDYECAYCGTKDNITQDHMVPLSKNGSHSKENIIPACNKCNASKKDKSLSEWYKDYKFYDIIKEKKILEYIRIQKEAILAS